jgi:DNA-binding NarL/FixJ family response regulator
LNRPAAAKEPIDVLLSSGKPSLLVELRRAIVMRAPAMRVVAACYGIQDAIRDVAHLKPDVVVIGVETCGADWKDALRRLDHRLVLLVATRADAVVHRRAVLAGACGVIEAAEAERWLAHAVDRVFAGEAWVPRSAIGEVVDALRTAAPVPSAGMTADSSSRKKRPKP